ncbi:MAG: cobalamin-binding protein [Nitrospiraceae bacterium]|nr:cobalamin-binding protein [Nitrospiraceae bacterium]
MRICSLVPGATEVVAALGLARDLVGISHECDYPASVNSVPVMVRPNIDSGRLSSAQIDAEVGALLSSHRSLYELDEPGFRAAAPDLIIAQDLCDVCAITPPQLQQLIRDLTPQPTVLSLSPHRLADILDDVSVIGRALQYEQQASAFAAGLRRRLEQVSQAVAAAKRPRVVCLEWLSPLYVAGHWVPDMVTAAGGADALGVAGEPSRRVTWAEVRAADPDVVLLMPCGFSIPRALTELTTLTNEPEWASLRSVRNGAVFLMDAISCFSRPGPRVVDGIEALAGLLHPDCVQAPPAERALSLQALVGQKT